MTQYIYDKKKEAEAKNMKETAPTEEVKEWAKKAHGIQDYKGIRNDRIGMLRYILYKGEIGNLRDRNDALSMAIALGKDLGYGEPPASGKSLERYYAEKIANETGKDAPIIMGSSTVTPVVQALPAEEKKKEAETEPVKVTEFVPNKSLINKTLADRSHMGTSFDPEKRAEQEISGFVQDVQNVYDNLKRYAKTPAQKALLIEEMQKFQAGYAQKYNEKLAAHGRTISSFITGGSKFPTRRAEKANASYDKRFQEMLDWKDRAEKTIIRKLKGEAIEEAGGEVPLLEKKLKDLEKLQEMMVEANKIIRKKVELGIEGDSKLKQLVSLGFSEQRARELLTEDFAGRKGFSYHLQNNNQEIHRLRDRIAQLQRKEVTETREFEFTDGHILDNQEDDRVQIFFDQKPSQDIISKLKGEGWHWSPSIGAWQRKRTEYALMSANRITGAQAETQFGQKEKEKTEEKPAEKEKPKEPEYKRPEYTLEQWTALYAPHLNTWSWNYYVKGFSSWWQKVFGTFNELKEFLQKGESVLWVHGVRGDEKVMWTPKTLTEPKLLKQVGTSRVRGDTLYSLEQPYFNSLDDKWVWRTNKGLLKTGELTPGDVDEAELLNAKEFTEAQRIEARIGRELEKYRMDDYSKAEIGSLWFVPDLVRDLIQDAQKLPKATSEKYLSILEDMRARAIAERNKREKAEKAEKEKPAAEPAKPEPVEVKPVHTEPKAEPAKVIVPELMFKSYIESTMLTTGALASPKFLSDEVMAKDIYKNIQVSLEEARQLVPKFRAFAEKRIGKDQIESVNQSFGIDVEQEAHNLGIDLADYAIIPVGDKVVLQHKTIVQKKYEIKEPKKHKEEQDRKLSELTAKKKAEKILRIDLDKYDAYEWGTRVKLIEKQAAKGEMKDVLATGHLSDEDYNKVKPFIKGVQQPRKPLKPTAHFVAKPDKFFICAFDIDTDKHSFEEVEGKPITIKGFEGHDLFLHKTKGAAGYSVTEGRSGTSIVRGIKTEREAKQEAEKVLNGLKRIVDKKIAEAIRIGGLSPRYIAVELKRRIEKLVEKSSEKPEPKVEKAVEKAVETVKTEPRPEPKHEPKHEVRVEPIHIEPKKPAKAKKPIKKFAEKFIKAEFGRAIVKKAKAGIIKLTSDDLKADVIILRG